MGAPFSEHVKIVLKTSERAMVDVLSLDNRTDMFVFARMEGTSGKSQLTFAVIGQNKDDVQNFLVEKTAAPIKAGPLKHALEDMNSVFQVIKGPDPLSTKETVAELDRVKILGCCTCSEGVSLLIVHKTDGAAEYRQALLMNKTITCVFDNEPEPTKKQIKTLTIHDSSEKCPLPGPK